MTEFTLYQADCCGQAKNTLYPHPVVVKNADDLAGVVAKDHTCGEFKGYKRSKVSISELNIRKSAGTNTAKTGMCTGVGVFTILEVREGKGSEAGWGRLKSGAGWISLDYCQRV